MRHRAFFMLTIGASAVIGTGSAAVAKTTFRVQRVTLTIEDTVDFVVSFPVRGGEIPHKALPLVVFATGYMGDATNYAGLYDHWVEAGYVVAAPALPEIDRRIADLRAVRDEVMRISDDPTRLDDLGLDRARRPDDRAFPKIDTDRMALVGKSLGAFNIMDLAFRPELRDGSFRAVISLTGGATLGDRLEDYDTPLLLVHGDHDELVPLSASQDAYARATGPKFFVTILGATHGSAFQGGGDPGGQVVSDVTLDFLDRYVKGKRSALRRLLRDGDVAGVATIDATP